MAVVAPETAVRLLPILEAYSSVDEQGELAYLFDVQLRSLEVYPPRRLAAIREPMEKPERVNTRRSADNLIDLAETRNGDGIVRTCWERQNLPQVGATQRSDEEFQERRTKLG